VRELARLGALDDELIRAGAAADSPQLKSYCLERMRARGLQPGEEALVIAAFDDPYPAVRQVAHEIARQLPDEKWSRMLARDTGRRSGGVRGLIADVTPDAKQLGAPLYPGARHWRFASSSEYGEVFTTSDDPDDVVAFYAKGGKPVLTAEEVEARREAVRNAGQDPMLMMQKMQDAMAAGEDPAAVMASLTEGSASASVDWTNGIDGREGIVDARYVVLAEEPVFGQPVPARVVAVFRDELMGETGLIFRNKPEPHGPDLSTPEAVEAFTRVQQILASPDAQPPY
jgi:hypothetical protein